MSLSFHIDDFSSLPPCSFGPRAEAWRTSARRKNATVRVAETFVIVTAVTRLAPSGPDRHEVVARARTAARGSELSARRLAYWLSLACGLPIACQFTVSRCVDSQ